MHYQRQINITRMGNGELRSPAVVSASLAPCGIGTVPEGRGKAPLAQSVRVACSCRTRKTPSRLGEERVEEAERGRDPPSGKDPPRESWAISPRLYQRCCVAGRQDPLRCACHGRGRPSEGRGGDSVNASPSTARPPPSAQRILPGLKSVIISRDSCWSCRLSASSTALCSLLVGGPSPSAAAVVAFRAVFLYCYSLPQNYLHALEMLQGGVLVGLRSHCLKPWKLPSTRYPYRAPGSVPSRERMLRVPGTG